MIIDRLENLAEYACLNPLFAEAMDYLHNHDLLDAEIGKTVLKEKDLSVTIAYAPPKTKEEAKLEAHKNYIDIQIPLTGVEVMGYTPSACCEETMVPYNSEQDIVFFTGTAQSYMAVEPGMFAVFFPQDAHAPGITQSGVKKAIFKVKA